MCLEVGTITPIIVDDAATSEGAVTLTLSHAEPRSVRASIRYVAYVNWPAEACVQVLDAID
jgi:hypothetical protein